MTLREGAAASQPLWDGLLRRLCGMALLPVERLLESRSPGYSRASSSQPTHSLADAGSTAVSMVACWLAGWGVVSGRDVDFARQHFTSSRRASNLQRSARAFRRELPLMGLTERSLGLSRDSRAFLRD